MAMEKTGVPVSLSGLSVTFTWRCQVAAGYEYNYSSGGAAGPDDSHLGLINI